MNYYHDLVTQKSWNELTLLSRQVEFVLIGGWATYLYTKSLKSKDIDIIVQFDALSRLKKTYDVQKNTRLRKYEAVKEEVHIDIYLPHFSHLGLPIEDIMDNTRSIDGFVVIDPDYLFIMKLYVLAERGRTPKGRKDFLDLISLSTANVCHFSTIGHLLANYQLSASKTVFFEFLSEHTQIAELNLATHSYAKLKKHLIASLGQDKGIQ